MSLRPHIVATVLVLLALGAPSSSALAADDVTNGNLLEGLATFPNLSARAQGSIGPYRASACGCFDRNLWHTALGFGAQWHRFVELEGEYRYGGIWIPRSGHVDFTGFAVGLRSALTPASDRWWDGFYGRAGWLVMNVSNTRHRRFEGVHLAVGHGIPLFDGRVVLEHELPFSWIGGELGHVTFGIRGSLRFLLYKR